MACKENNKMVTRTKILNVAWLTCGLNLMDPTFGPNRTEATPMVDVLSQTTLLYWSADPDNNTENNTRFRYPINFVKRFWKVP